MWKYVIRASISWLLKAVSILYMIVLMRDSSYETDVDLLQLTKIKNDNSIKMTGFRLMQAVPILFFNSDLPD
jgi:hypothetical protein